MTPPSFKVILAQMHESHVNAWIQWRKDPETRQQSIRDEKWSGAVAKQKYAEEISRYPNAPAVFLLKGGALVAFLSFRFPPLSQNQGRMACEISIVVAPEYRRQGIGGISLVFAKQWLTHFGFDDVYAIIKKENRVSKQLFTKEGWKHSSEISLHNPEGKEIALDLYKLSLTPIPLSTKGNVFFIAEAGSNWKGDSKDVSWNRAQKLIEKAAFAGADAIKFQMFRPKTLYAPGAGKSSYLEKSGFQNEMNALFEHLAMPYEMLPALAKICKQQGIILLCTPFSVQDFEVVNAYVPFHKLASYEIGHVRLLERMAASQKPTFISTGAAQTEEIDWAVQHFRKKGGKDLFLLQCTAAYPAPLDSLNVGTIPWLKKRFGCGVGLSDHSREPLYGPLAAVTLGASVIEKHFTLDDDLITPDRPVSLFPHELKELVQAIRSLERVLGDGQKKILPIEKELRSFAHRGVQAVQNIEKGDLLREGENIDVLRPGNLPQGVHARYLEEIEGKAAKREISTGEGIQYGDW